MTDPSERTTARAIHQHDEALWRHLSNSIRTGAFCTYAPEQPVEWELS
jgi:hypothetical protein